MASNMFKLIIMYIARKDWNTLGGELEDGGLG